MIKKIDKYIEIVRAGDVHFSSMGIKSGQMIQLLLSKYYRRVELSTVSDQSDLDKLAAKNPDFVFLGLKRIEIGNEYVWLSEYLDSKGINYSGSQKSAMKLDLSKTDAKSVVRLNNLDTSDYFTTSPGQHVSGLSMPLEFPVFIKPFNQGGGMGIGPDSVAHNFFDYQKKVENIFERFNVHSLVENYLEGREFSVGVLGNEHGPEFEIMPVELITKPNANGDKILGQVVKSQDNERAIYIEDPQIREQIAELGMRVFRALGGRDYGRIDIRMDNHGTPNFIEANLTPGIASNTFVSYFTRACQLNLGMTYEDMILKIVQIGIDRDAQETDDNYLNTSANLTLVRSLSPIVLS